MDRKRLRAKATVEATHNCSSRPPIRPARKSVIVPSQFGGGSSPMFAYLSRQCLISSLISRRRSGLAVAFLALYVLITPHKEFALIRAGNSAAAVQLTGTFLGFAVPMAVVIGHSVNIPDMLLWGVSRRWSRQRCSSSSRGCCSRRSRNGSPSAVSPRASSSAGWGLASASSRPPAWFPERRYGGDFTMNSGRR